MAAEQWVDSGNNLWIGAKSSNQSFQDIVSAVAGRWAIIDKKFDDGGYLWIMCGDKDTKVSLRAELGKIPGWTLNFGRESDAYVPAKSSNAYDKKNPIPSWNPKEKEYTAQQWESFYEEQKVL